VSFLADLQSRIPDRWFFRRLLPAAVYVVLVVVCGGQLGQGHWSDLALARARLAAGLRVSGSSAPQAVASLILFAVAIAICAFAVPVAATAIDALASSAWPWWLVPLGYYVRKIRQWRWEEPESRNIRALQLRNAGGPWRQARAVRLERLRDTAATEPKLYTWSADRFEATRQNIKDSSGGVEITNRWTDLLLVMPEAARAILTAARDSYDAACEALAWSAAVFVLGCWWWPAFAGGLLLACVAWHWLRRSVTGLCDAAEAAARVYASQLVQGIPAARPAGRGRD
jgi:hypothetical protein